MFKDLSLLPKYTLGKNDIVNDFFNPVLKEAVKYDRTSAYFSAKAFALYGEGLEYFERKNSKYRLIISKDVSEYDYNQIKTGYKLRDEIVNQMVDSLNQELTLEEEKNISNLAYYIACGVVDIKIAFKEKGIFHDKCGILTDERGDIISYTGSVNETVAGLTYNYESITLTCSWLDKNGFYLAGIKSTQKDFDDLWNNQYNDVIVLDAQDVIINKILEHNKGEVIVEEVMLEKDALILDYDEYLETASLHANLDDIGQIINSAFYKMKIKRFVERLNGNNIYLKKNITYIDLKKIDNLLKDRFYKSNIKYSSTKRFKNYINSKELYIEKRKKLGVELKKNPTFLTDKYDEFKKIVNSKFVRSLRDKQMQDAFFMYAMIKSANFSVPGSGKTSSALAVYAVLKERGFVDKILMIGPKNSFGSWIDEFKACFGDKEELKLLSRHDTHQTTQQLKQRLKFNYQNYNLILFNYESLKSYEKELTELVSKKTLLIFDEVHKIKSVYGDRANHALKIASKSSFTIAMTGTPIPNSYADIYNLLHVLYCDEYNEYFGYDSAELKNPNEDLIYQINKDIQPFFCRTTKQQLLVPEANPDTLFKIQCSNSEQEIFDILRKKYKNNNLALFIRILQLESNPRMLLEKIDLNEFSDVLDIDEEIDNVDFVDYSQDIKTLIDSMDITTKKKSCVELVEKLVKDGKKTVVWCIFKDSINSIKELLNKRGIKCHCIYGEVDLFKRQELISDFKNGTYDVLITNPHTLAESVSLHSVCHDAVYFEYSYNLVHLLQSKDRIHRLGLLKEQYTQYYFLESNYLYDGKEYSVDEKVYQRLKEKEETMLRAIDNDVLEPVCTSEEDLNLIFKGL